ncbi:uncharacterized protein LOC141614131 [Silene latifolia]|uniref:uncharacterized protein LOC141614131 n=1 Tax=Silene latifolia TaxID=37657 RepID=UPI003D789AE4
MEILSRFLRQLCKQPQVSFHPKCCKLNLTHLIFVDDLIIFIRGDVPSVRAVKGALNTFAKISELNANVDKTSIYFGGESQAVQEDILAFLLKKVQHWSEKLLTYAGKLQLRNAVLFGIENFWCSSVLLPKEVITKLTQLSRTFFWGIPEGERKLIFKRWDQICAPWKKRRFNIKNIRIWNIALQLHWVWKSSANSEGLWTKWHKAYSLKQHTIWDVDSKDSYSSSLKGILIARDIFLAKAEYVHTAEGLLASCLSGHKLQTNCIYEYLLDIPDQDVWTSTLLHSRITPTHRIISILDIQGNLSTVDNLKEKGFLLANRCCLCQAAEESSSHLFFHCSFTSAIWTALQQWMGVSHHHQDLIED